MIRWWAVYLAFMYAAGVTLNIILVSFADIRGLWLIPADCGFGVFTALCMYSLALCTRKRTWR